MIEARGLQKSFDEQPVLDAVNFNVPKDSTFVVLGQSGSGKSVLLKIIAGLLYPTQGTVKLGTKNIGMLFQKNALFDSMTVIENLEFTLRERSHPSIGLTKEKSMKFLAAVGLEGTQNLYPDELSGGMQKRLGIARALIVAPELILYDEPTAGLDPITSRIIADLILNLKQEYQSTLVVVTSDVMRAYQYCSGRDDQIALLMSGSLVIAGNAQAAQKNRNPALMQFLQGLTQGPLTNGN